MCSSDLDHAVVFVPTDVVAYDRAVVVASRRLRFRVVAQIDQAAAVVVAVVVLDDGAFAVVNDGQVTLVNCNIEPYKQGNSFNHEPKRQRRLLLNKNEIRGFAEKAKVKGFTLVPLSIYLKEGRAKVELAVCRGKQVHDKRQALKERDAKREIRQQ